VGGVRETSIFFWLEGAGLQWGGGDRELSLRLVRGSEIRVGRMRESSIFFLHAMLINLFSSRAEVLLKTDRGYPFALATHIVRFLGL